MSTPHSFFDEYAAAFARYEAPALAGLFSFPLQIVSVAEKPNAISVASRDDWLPLLDGLLGTYRQLGVAAAMALELEVAELTPSACSARVHWELRRDDSSPIYDFIAVYTLAQIAGQWRIFAIAHDELPKLRAALDR